MSATQAILRRRSAHSRSCEPQCSPFGSIVELCEQQLLSPLDGPCLELLFFLEIGLLELPLDLTASVSADPLTVYVDVNVNVKGTLDVHSQVGCWDRLPQGRGGSDWGQEGEYDLCWRANIVARGNEVRKIGDRSVVLRADIGRERHVIATIRQKIAVILTVESRPTPHHCCPRNREVFQVRDRQYRSRERLPGQRSQSGLSSAAITACSSLRSTPLAQCRT